ncbi:hypothetical protein [Geothrix fuzhouensis]|uniref:hypothetical protein n=1 Tax=Geothrix fuzhouensis TaxID=2966451 RepID=UPI00214916DE|nr:hypothetical protein [Geothrix fuzhouensis]
MSLQHAAIELLDYASQSLVGLADSHIQDADCRFAGAKLSEAATRLRVEPLHREDTRATFQLMQEAAPSLRKLLAADLPSHFKGWAIVACEAYNAVLDLLDGLEGFQKHVQTNDPKAAGLGPRLRRLLPSGWWGSHV